MESGVKRAGLLTLMINHVPRKHGVTAYQPKSVVSPAFRSQNDRYSIPFNLSSIMSSSDNSFCTVESIPSEADENKIVKICPKGSPNRVSNLNRKNAC